MTSAPAPSDATRAVVRASAKGSNRSKLMLNRAATFPRVSFFSPPVTCTSFVCGGRPCRKKKSPCWSVAISCRLSTARMSGRSSERSRKSRNIETVVSLVISCPSIRTRAYIGRRDRERTEPLTISIPKTLSRSRIAVLPRDHTQVCTSSQRRRGYC